MGSTKCIRAFKQLETKGAIKSAYGNRRQAFVSTCGGSRDGLGKTVPIIDRQAQAKSAIILRKGDLRNREAGCWWFAVHHTSCHMTGRNICIQNKRTDSPIRNKLGDVRDKKRDDSDR
jgi:hypothetical protein